MLDDLHVLSRSRSAPILLEGESGTGKTTLARLIHEWSPRASGPFQLIVLSTLDDGLAGSTLFGHTVGAFTDARQARPGGFASAQGGTIFLDELGRCSLHIQQKLLHIIETGEFQPVGSDRLLRVDTRVIGATSTPLDEGVSHGSVLPDLFARIEPFRIRIPALRERRCDIPDLAEAILRKRAFDTGYAQAPRIDQALMTVLQRAPWPYNLRQLDGTLQRIMLHARGSEVLTIDHCKDAFPDMATTVTCTVPLTPKRAREAVAIAGTVKGAAKLLGVDRTTVHRHLRKPEAADQGPAPETPP